jgi:hypothetical protein
LQARAEVEKLLWLKPISNSLLASCPFGHENYFMNVGYGIGGPGMKKCWHRIYRAWIVNLAVRVEFFSGRSGSRRSLVVLRRNPEIGTESYIDLERLNPKPGEVLEN